jgi:peptidoglycan/xylan/chitin deacetylase (PgdA/CDA1 family)
VGRRLGAAALLLALVSGFVVAIALPLGWFGGRSSRAAELTQSVRKANSGPRRVLGRHDSPVPILMYHVLGTPRAGAVFPELFVEPSNFKAQMAWLSRHGYHAVTLRQVFRYWRSGIALPRKPIVLSFDDGYLSDYTIALPVLRRYRWPGVLNLVVHNVKPGDLTAREVRRLIAAGWELDAHTISHVDLTRLDPAGLRREVAGSRKRLRRMFGQRVDFFCYPLGHYNAAVVAAVRAAGYLGATTEDKGLARPARRFTLPRIRLSSGDGAAQLAAKLG